MPWEILKKAILSATFIHLLLFLAIAVPSGNPVRKKFVRVSLYSVGGGKEKKETKGLPAIEKVEGNELKAESTKEEIREEVKNKEASQVRTPKESPGKSQLENREKQKEEKTRKQDVSKKEVALKKDKEKKLEGIKGKRESKGGDKEKKTVSQKPSGGEIREGTGKGGGGEGMGKGEKEGEGEESVTEDIKNQYGTLLWKTVKEKWTIVSPLKGKNLKAEVLVKISSDGKIIERKIEKSSGNPTFDAIALSVIDSIETFSPPPWNPKKPVEIIFIFSSE